MKGDFIVLVVCAALVQISLVKVSPTTAVIQAEEIDDIELLRLYREASTLRLKKGAEFFFPKNLHGYSAKSGACDKDSNEDIVNGTEICMDKVFSLAIGIFDATLAAALTADSGITPAAISARPALINSLEDIIKGLCSALKLAVDKKSTTNAAEIQAIADDVVPASANWNRQFFDAVKARRHLQPELFVAFKEAEERSTHELVSAFNETFNGIQILASLDLQAGSDEILSTLNTFRNRVFSRHVSSIEKKFDVSETPLITLSVIASSQDVNSSATRNVSNDGQCGSKNATEVARSQIKKGFSTWINTIQFFLDKTSAQSSNSSQNNYSTTKTAKKETADALNNAINAVIEAVLRIYPGCSSIVGAKRDAAVDKMGKLLDNIYYSINSIRGTDPNRVLSELEATEIETIGKSSGVVEDLIEGILYCVQEAHSSPSVSSPPTIRSDSFPNIRLLGLLRPRVSAAKTPGSPIERSKIPEVDAELRSSVQPGLEKSITKIQKLFRIIYTAIKVRMVEIAAEIQTASKAIVPSMKNTQDEASMNGKAAMQIIVDVIETFLKASTNKQLDNATNLLALEVYREKISFKIEKALDIIFSNILAISENVNESSVSDVIKARHAITSAAYLAGFRKLLCVFPTNDSSTTIADEEIAASLVQRVVDIAYMAIEKSVGNNSCEFRSHSDALEAALADSAVKMMSYLYNQMRKSPSYNDQMEQVFTRTQGSSISGLRKIASSGFKGMKTLATTNCPTSRPHIFNMLPSFTDEYQSLFSNADNFIQGLDDGVSSVALVNVNNILQKVSQITSRLTDRLHLKTPFLIGNIGL